jgi:hypothetical protein
MVFRVCLTSDNELLQGQAGEDSTDGRKTVDGVGEEKMSVKFGMVWDQSSDKIWSSRIFSVYHDVFVLIHGTLDFL